MGLWEYLEFPRVSEGMKAYLGISEGLWGHGCVSEEFWEYLGVSQGI